MGYSKFNWVGNQIDDRDMSLMYRRKEKEGIPITKQVAEAVKEYLIRRNIV